MKIRRGEREDLSFLEQMLFEAFHWNPDQPRPEYQEFQRDQKFRLLLADWGRPGDAAVIAVEGGMSVGAAWYRLWTREEHSYGFVDPAIPELGMAVLEGNRSKGVGRALLRALIQVARAEGMEALSLSVDPANIALQLYESERFIKVSESGTSWTLFLKL